MQRVAEATVTFHGLTDEQSDLFRTPAKYAYRLRVNAKWALEISIYI